MGGTVTNAQGQSSEMAGVLQLRSQGMGWGNIAHTVGVHPAQSGQGAARSMHGRDGERLANISSSQSHALGRDSTAATGGPARGVSEGASGANTTQPRGAASSSVSNPGGRSGGTASAALSKASAGGRDSGSSAIGAAASHASGADRGSSAFSASTSRGGDKGHARGDVTSPGRGGPGAGAVAGASVADGNKHRGASAQAGLGLQADSSTSGPGNRGNGNKDKGGGHGKKH